VPLPWRLHDLSQYTNAFLAWQVRFACHKDVAINAAFVEVFLRCQPLPLTFSSSTLSLANDEIGWVKNSEDRSIKA
jgi:hypothetical protein